MANTIVAGDMYREIDGQLFEIKRQLRQPNGYPFDPAQLKVSLQQIIEGKFVTPAGNLIQVPIPQPQASPPSLFKAEDTNLASAIAEAEVFNKNIMGVKVDLRKMFDLPTELLWKNVLVIYDPGLNNRQAVERALQGQKLRVYEESNVMEYSGSQANSQPTLRIIENSLRPTADTLGTLAKSPDQLNADGRTYLDLRGYALAFGLRYFTSKDKFDPETWTWFPKNRLPSGGVARGDWRPGVLYRRVKFDWSRAGRVDASCGARLAMDVPLKT